MKNPYATFAENPLRGLFGPLVWPRTYTNLLYLMLGFPLGLAYFVLYVTGFALGLGLLVLLVGAAILAALVVLAWPLTLLERELAIRLLDAPVPPPGATTLPDTDVGTWLKSVLTNPVTWKGLLFVGLKFPLGLASWVAAVVMLSVSAAFTAAPLVYAFGGNVQLGSWEPASMGAAALLAPVGIVAFVLSIHALNGLAWLWGRFAVVMLGRGTPTPPAREAETKELTPVTA